MDLPWGDERTLQFITNVGLVTTDGPNGQNIMACEWTHHVSYSPGLIVVCIRAGGATHENIIHSKKFGVGLGSEEQNVLASLSGGHKGKEYDKISALKELGYGFYDGKKIKAPMVRGAVVNIECKLVKVVEIGSHTIFVGEVLDAVKNPGAPLALHEGKYWKMTQPIEKPTKEEREKMEAVFDSHTKFDKDKKD
jgi:flavin reductase (DIM6/NTAB) family NADH-FMN oxidoreductase RutF